MEYRRLLFLSAVFLMLNFNAGKIYSQENSTDNLFEKNYYITQDERDRPKFVQKLSWQSVPEIQSYRIEIQKFENEAYTTILEADAIENFIEISLEPGNYRFQVSAMNLFGKEKKSKWQDFEVLKALLPKINSVEPNPMYLNVNKDGIIILKGENFLPQTSFQIHRLDSAKNVVESFDVTVISVDDNRKTAQLQFDIKKAVEGNYEICVQNPGGLSDSYKTVDIKKGFIIAKNVQVSVGYIFPIELFDGKIEQYTDSKYHPLSGNAKLSFVGTTSKIGILGFGLNANYSNLNSSYSDQNISYDFSGNYANALVNLVYQNYIFKNKLNQRLKYDLHFGVGPAMLFAMQIDSSSNYYSSPQKNFLGVAFDGGVALQYYFTKKKHFYFETGADLIYTKFSDMIYTTVNPSFSIGGMF